jgi:hypothetical protein
LPRLQFSISSNQRRNRLKIDKKSFSRLHADELKYDIECTFSKSEIDKLAKETGFVERRRKLSATDLVSTLMFSCYNQAQTSLEDIAADLHQHFAIDISKEAIHKRFTNQGVHFLKELIKQQLSRHFTPSHELSSASHFTCIKIKDSTKFSLPNTYNDEYPGFGNFSKKNGLMQIQYEYDLLSGQWEELMLTNRSRNDQKDSNQTIDAITEGGLHIRDLGYITPTYLKAVIAKAAYFLNRLPPQATIYTSKKKEMNWKAIDRKFKRLGISTFTMDAFIYEKHTIPCRLVIERLDEKGYEKRLKHALKSAKSRKVGLSENHRIRCRYNTFITNIEQKKLAVESIRKTYYLRWQIELVFKSWKSFFEIDKVKKVKRERLECQLLAQLLWILVNWKLFNICNHYIQKHQPNQGVSVLKFFKRCRSFSHSLRNVLLAPNTIDLWLENIFLPAIYNTLSEAPSGKITHYQVIYQCLS